MEKNIQKTGDETYTQKQQELKAKIFPEFKCLCGNNFFVIKTYITPTKRKYKPGQKFEITQMRKRLKCAACGRQYWENQVFLDNVQLSKIIKEPRNYVEMPMSRLPKQTNEKRR